MPVPHSPADHSAPPDTNRSASTQTRARSNGPTRLGRGGVAALLSPSLAPNSLIGIVTLYFVLVLWALNLAAQARDRFGAVLCVGAAALFFWHVIINVGMVTRLLPVMGVTLPLVSYGGWSVFANMRALGLLMSVSIRRFGH